MPELPEVETTVRGLRKVLEGEWIKAIATHRGDLRTPFPPDLRQRATGAKITKLGRRAKYGLIETDRDDTLIFHLGMTGKWRVDPEMIEKHDHLVIETGNGRTVALNDARRFGQVDLWPTATLDDYPAFKALGPEPLGPQLTAAYLDRKLAGRTASIKAALLDQRIVAGLGNIYVCEALFVAGISPKRAAGQIATPRLAKLVEAIRAVLNEAIKAGGSSLRDYRQPDGDLGYFSKQFHVYGRAGQPCHDNGQPGCGGKVVRYADGGRSTWWCPKCQK